ncbi:arginine/ornithine antiporter arcD [Vibrio ishigakensis]|uniref:Arginine/ornithine antiporter arcD n=1 Tax=Vibrio ishigakensis TaxID=1481914 RepID=A0A0B8P615_9VIBR|nr:arginine/ornithine antiporter arcD [Vibrio ishigakensis]
MFFIEVLLSFLVPSTSGLAVLTMPIMHLWLTSLALVVI